MVFDRSHTFERAERTELRVLISFFLERTELTLLSDCVMLCSESELISITCSGGGSLEGGFLCSFGAGAIAAFCWKQTFRLEKVGIGSFKWHITLSGMPVREGNMIGLYTLIAAAFFTS